MVAQRKQRRSPRSKQRSDKGGTRGQFRIEYCCPESLTPDPRNPRRISRQQMRALERSIGAFGLVDPIIVRKQDRTVVGGHQRLAAARKMGIESVPVVFLDLTEEDAATLSIALNKIQGEWDLHQLEKVLTELRDLPDVDVGLTGFEVEELEDLLAELEAGRPIELRLDELQSLDAAQTQPGRVSRRAQDGQLWQLGEHRLLCGDALGGDTLSGLARGEIVAAIVTDPPYGIGYQSRMPKPGARKQAIANDEFEHFGAFLERTLPLLKGLLEPGGTIYCFCGAGGPLPVLGMAQSAFARHVDLTNLLVWDKQSPGLGFHWRSSWEAIVEATAGARGRWYGGNHRRNVLSWPKLIPQADDHPTPKPVGLLAELIRVCTRPGEVVMDPFCGSGSTLLAAELDLAPKEWTPC